MCSLIMGLTNNSARREVPVSISIYTDEESKKTIEAGAKSISLNVSAFCRTVAFREAKRILKENQEASD